MLLVGFGVDDFEWWGWEVSIWVAGIKWGFGFEIKNGFWVRKELVRYFGEILRL
jgi:hypothetical protein